MKFSFKRVVVLLIAYLFVFLNINFLIEGTYVLRHGEPVIEADSEKIGTISLYASPVPYPDIKRITGHSWIYIENTSDKSFYIDDVIVPPGEGISLGTTANPKMGHRGVWINVEGYNDHYKDNVSITGDFYPEDLKYVEEYISNHDRWNIVYNCAYFATDIWNNVSAGEGREVHAITPIGLSLKLLKTDGYSTDQEIEVFEYMKPYTID